MEQALKSEKKTIAETILSKGDDSVWDGNLDSNVFDDDGGIMRGYRISNPHIYIY